MRARILTTISLLVFLVLPLGLFFQRQAIFDWYRLRNYTPSIEIAQLAESTTMTDAARRLFYIYYPQLQDQDEFNSNCRNSEVSIVLGCYVEQSGIYIYRVVDPRLEGIEEVTAAHEMLHVAYERLSDSERQNIDSLTQRAFETVTNERILRAVEAYRERDALVVPNELHSIIATEVRDLSPDLEDYYKRYFTNRTRVVELSEQYENAFTEREQQVARFDAQLASLRTQIDSNQQSLDNLSAAIDSERGRLDDLRAQGRNQEYNAAVPPFNALVRRYNTTVSIAQGLIDQYNDIVTQRNLLVVEEQELVDAIDSRPETVESQ